MEVVQNLILILMVTSVHCGVDPCPIQLQQLLDCLATLNNVITMPTDRKASDYGMRVANVVTDTLCETTSNSEATKCIADILSRCPDLVNDPSFISSDLGLYIRDTWTWKTVHKNKNLMCDCYRGISCFWDVNASLDLATKVLSSSFTASQLDELCTGYGNVEQSKLECANRIKNKDCNRDRALIVRTQPNAAKILTNLIMGGNAVCNNTGGLAKIKENLRHIQSSLSSCIDGASTKDDDDAVDCRTGQRIIQCYVDSLYVANVTVDADIINGYQLARLAFPSESPTDCNYNLKLVRTSPGSDVCSGTPGTSSCKVMLLITIIVSIVLAIIIQ